MDSPVETRKGEELDLSKLNEFIKGGQAVHLPLFTEQKQFPGGYSNLTYLDPHVIGIRLVRLRRQLLLRSGRCENGKRREQGKAEGREKAKGMTHGRTLRCKPSNGEQRPWPRSPHLGWVADGNRRTRTTGPLPQTNSQPPI